MGDVFDYLSSLDDDHCLFRKPHTLEKGTLYKVYKFVVQEIDEYRSVLAYSYDETLKFYCYLPKKLSKMPNSKVKELNDAIAAGENPSLCFYGKVGNANIMDIHKAGTDCNQALLIKIGKLEKMMGENANSPENSPKRGYAGVADGGTPKKRKFGESSEAE